MSLKDDIVHLWDLPENEVCVKLPDEIQQEMITKALEIIKGRYNLAKTLNVRPINIYDFEKCRFNSITLSFVKRLSNLLVANNFDEFSLVNIESKLEFIKAKFTGVPIFHPKFPISFNSEEGARIISAFLFDGGISSRGYPFYTNNEEVLVDILVGYIGTIVGQIICRKSKDENTYEVEFPRILGHILICGLGMQAGKKVLTDPTIPEFILKGDTEIKLSFLQQAFDDEGSLNNGKSGKCVELNQYTSSNVKAPKRLVRLKELIESFYIPVNGPYGPTKEHIAKDGTKTYGWSIQISNQSDIRTFAENINFTLERKRKKLQELLASYKLPPRFKNGIKYQEILKAIKNLKKENRPFTTKNISQIINKSQHYVAELTNDMVRQNLLKVTKERLPIGSGKGFYPKEFEIM